MDNKVYVVRCPDYDQVEEKMSELMVMMGGMAQFAASGDKIVLKTNLLLAAKPERAATTHPEVVAAVGRLAKQAGATAVITDSPGSGYEYNERTLTRVYRTCGMYQAAEKAGIEVNLDTTHKVVSFPEGALIKRFEVITPVAEADGVFNLCKLKTHLFTGMTGAVKNNFGVIAGRAKPGYHAKLADQSRFAEMLLDLAAYVSPRLSIMDAVVGMEGQGPNAGTPRRIGLLLASTNPLALDVIANEIIGLCHVQNPVLVAAEKRGLSPTRPAQVELIGARLPDLRIPSYKFPQTVVTGDGLGGTWWHRPLAPLFKNGFTLRPQVDRDKCIACGACFEACPKKIITMVDRKYAQINEKECIRCYCCHEMCPRDAIQLRSNWLYRFFN